jgi:signal transduction histidine kinase
VSAPLLQEIELSGAPRDRDYHRHLVALTRLMRHSRGIDDIAPELVESVVRASGATAGGLYLAAGDGETPYRLIAHTGPPRFVRAIGDAGLPPWLSRATSPTRLPDPLVALLTTPAVPAAVVAPLRWRTTLLGFIVLGPSRSGDYGPDDLDFLEAVADQAAASIVAVRLSEATAAARDRERPDRVTAAAIHDIKNSVSALSMLAHNATTNLSDPEFQRDAVAALLRTVERMRRVLVTLSSPFLEAPRSRREAVELRGVILEATTALAADRRIRLVRRLGPVGPVHGDRDALLRVVENLTTNAAEAIDHEGIVTVTLTEADGHAVISVADTGCGIPTEHQAHLFSPFHSTKNGGWGVGLYQTKQVVESQFGEILVESAVGCGTTIVVRLPLQVHAENSSLETVR